MNHILFKNSVVYMVSGILNASIPFILLPILTRVLSPSDYGMVAMFSLVVSMLGAFTGLNVQSALTVKFFQTNTILFKEYVSSSLVILLISTAIVLLVIIFLSESISNLTLLPRGWLIVAVITSGAQIAIQIRLAIWQVQHKALYYGSLLFTQGIVNMGLSIYLVLALNLAWQGRLIGILASTIIFMLVGIYLLKSHQEIIKPQHFKETVSDILKFSIPLTPHVIGAIMLSSIDRLIISNHFGLSEAGIYSVAIQIGGAMSLLTSAFNNAYSPWLMSKLKTEDIKIKNKIVRGTYGYFLILITLAIGVSMAAPLLLLLVGEEYRGTGYLFIYIAIGQAFTGMYLMLSTYILYSNKTGLLSLLTITTAGVNALATYILININGLTGVAQAFAFSMILRFFCAWIFTQRMYPMPWVIALIPSRISR